MDLKMSDYEKSDFSKICATSNNHSASILVYKNQDNTFNLVPGRKTKGIIYE